MITNQATLDTAATTFRAVGEEIFGQTTPGMYDVFTEVIPTGSKVNEIDLLETMPVVREWLGEKEYASIIASKLSATIKKYEKSMEIDRLDLTADKLGLIARRIRTFLGNDGAAIYDKLCTEALIANGTGYDGVALFSASHPRGPAGATQSNTGTTALSFAQFEAVMVAGASLRDGNGEPLGISYDVLMVGPKLAALGREITQSAVRVGGIAATGEAATASVVTASTIPNYRGLEVYTGGSVTLVVNPRLVGTYDDYYYMIDSKRGVKPIMLYEFRRPEPIEQFSMDSDARFNLDKFRCSVECDVVAAPGLWQAAYAGIV